MRLGKRGVERIVNEILLKQPALQAGELAQAAGISRQAAHRHLAALAREGALRLEGKGRAARYLHFQPAALEYRYPLSGLSEDRVWAELSKKVACLQAITENVSRISGYAITELINNAIDHSSGSWVQITFLPSDSFLSFKVEDDGVGIFHHLERKLALPDTLSAIQELSKGKVTTDPERHTGEGIFFISKIADVFVIESNGLAWTVDNLRDDMAVGRAPERKGTLVRCEIDLRKTRTLESLFAEYTRDYEFTRTRIVIKLFDTGARFVSRSEAKRILERLEKFKEVALDFNGVKDIGQGFADEMFRVWAKGHPGTTLIPMNMNAAVEFMIKRARGGSGGSE